MIAAISGASGFIGSRLKEVLEGQGFEVYPIPREIYYSATRLPQFLSINKPDFIFHMAAYGNMANQESIPDMIAANIIGSANLLTAALNTPYKAFINVSTSSVLLNYETFYSATKASTERLAKAFVNKFKSPIVTVRPFSVYGPKEADFRFIPTVFRSCLKQEQMNLSPNAFHDWVYIDDFVNAMIDIADHVDKYKGKSINIGTGKSNSNEFIVKNIEKLTGQKAQIKRVSSLRDFDTSIWQAQPSDYLVKTTLEEGLRKVYEQTKGNIKDK
jgi:nucleoside-diphosphate-sugar epimerase